MRRPTSSRGPAGGRSGVVPVDVLLDLVLDADQNEGPFGGVGAVYDGHHGLGRRLFLGTGDESSPFLSRRKVWTPIAA